MSVLWIARHETNKGKIRYQNEDSFVSEAFVLGEKCYLFCGVADGLGGHLAGDVASQLAVETMTIEVRRNLIRLNPSDAMKLAAEVTNHKIYSEAHTSEIRKGMCSTLTVALIQGDDLYIAHVGDSRAYLCRGEKIVHLTEDHSVANELVKKGEVLPQDAEQHPQRHMLTKALGSNEQIDIDSIHTKIFPGEILFLCTDGVTRMVEDAELAKLLRASDSISENLNSIMVTALMRGAPDNITAIVATWEARDLE
ncbi:MAG: Stp1/IreP family PP2C-type Ser/Thr phosphatase [bacterium]|nr:Stp1/IreP family PP2C-type Ser/Thr phosphatase [bacterium]